jgi:GTP diphosphokinase / guanosine-3',5'-bis(diphosphate) 3'-diphosphatase
MLSDLSRILAAAQFAAEKHVKQRRKGRVAEPYVNHLIEVAHLVSGALSEPDANLVMAAFLHDTVEDVGVTAEELKERFGADVAALVLEVTDDKSLPQEERKQLQVEHAPHLSVRAGTIKLADKISNLRSMIVSPPADWSDERIRNYFAWAKNVVAGLPEPNQALKAEFDLTVRRFENL